MRKRSVNQSDHCCNAMQYLFLPGYLFSSEKSYDLRATTIIVAYAAVLSRNIKSVWSNMILHWNWSSPSKNVQNKNDNEVSKCTILRRKCSAAVDLSSWRIEGTGSREGRGSKVLNGVVCKNEVPLYSETRALSILLSRFHFLFPLSSFLGSVQQCEWWKFLSPSPLQSICPALSQESL